MYNLVMFPLPTAEVYPGLEPVVYKSLLQLNTAQKTSWRKVKRKMWKEWKRAASNPPESFQLSKKKIVCAPNYILKNRFFLNF